MWKSNLKLMKNLRSRLFFAVHLKCKSTQSYYSNSGSESLRYKTVGQVLLDSANTWPNRIAVKSLHENISLTYQDLIIQADMLAGSLLAHGLQKGDRFGIWCHNNVYWIIAFFAAARAGLVSVLINPFYERSELKYCISKTQLNALMIGDETKMKNYHKQLCDVIPELAESKAGQLSSLEHPYLKTVISCSDESLPGTLRYKSFVRPGVQSANLPEPNPKDGCVIYFTSGTTGDPKAALNSHYAIVNNSYFTGKRATLAEYHHIHCLQAPLFHALGSAVCLMFSVSHGATSILPSPTYNAVSNFDAMHSESCTLVYGTPTMYVDLVNQARFSKSPSSLKVTGWGGADASPQLLNDIKKYLKPDIVQCVYGMTETSGIVFQNFPDDPLDRVVNTVGYLQDHLEVKVVDDNGITVPFGESGELLVRGYSNLIKYWNEERQAYDEDGWIYTGDKFILNEDGYGRMECRIKDLIVRGGEKISPKEIENVVNEYPKVIESQVIGISDERLGEEICVIVKIRQDCSTIHLQDIRKHCEGRIAKFKIPKVLKIVEEFPKTSSGKIKRSKLKEMVEAENI